MVVGTLEAGLRLEGCFSLKDKRQVLRSLLTRIRRDYAVSAAEVADLDLWNSAVVGFAMVTNHPTHAESVLSQVEDAIHGEPRVVVESIVRNIDRP